MSQNNYFIPADRGDFYTSFLGGMFAEEKDVWLPEGVEPLSFEISSFYFTI